MTYRARQTQCTSRGSNPDHRILSPALSPLKVLVPRAHPNQAHRRLLGGVHE
jgi:hypothetical protein